MSKKRDTIGIIGFGYVGRAIQHGFAQTCDFRIYDINPTISENTLEEVCKDSEYIFVCVPTPMKSTGECDISIVEYTVKKCHKYLKNTDKILIIKSTVVPFTTYMLKNKYPHMRIVFNPEFLTARTYKLDFINSARIILGGNIADTRKVEILYRKRFPDKSVPIYHTDSTTAETVKELANCFLATKVLLCNEFYDICDKIGVDYNEVMEMILADGRIGRSHTDVPGHDSKRGISGVCFPKDMNAMIHMAKALGVEPMIMEAAWKKNLQVRPKKDWEKLSGVVSHQ